MRLLNVIIFGYGGCSSVVELRTVAPAVEGSNPSTHPKILHLKQTHNRRGSKREKWSHGSNRARAGRCVAGANYASECYGERWHCPEFGVQRTIWAFCDLASRSRL